MCEMMHATTQSGIMDVMSRSTISCTLLFGIVLSCLVPFSGCNNSDGSSVTTATGGQSAGGGSNADIGDNPGVAGRSVSACTNAIETVCAGYADYEMRCSSLTADERDTEYAACVEYADSPPINCTYASAYAACLAAKECGTSDDRCVAEGFLATAPPGWNLPVLRGCLAGTVTDETACDAAVGGDTRNCINRLEECIGGPYAGATDPPFTDDHCFAMVALVPAATTAAVECLSLPCDSILDCLTTAGTFNY